MQTTLQQPRRDHAMKRGTISRLLTTGILVCATSISQAAIVDSWDFVLDMKWDTSANATKFDNGNGRGSYGVGTQIVTPTSISWGATNGSYYNPQAQKARSGIEITQPYVTGNLATSFVGEAPVIAKANMFTHHNGAILGSFKSLERAKMDVTVQLRNPDTNELVVDIPRSFEIHFYETRNIPGRCAWGLCEDDIFAVVSGMDLTDTFSYEGVEYTLNYFETTAKVKELSSTTCGIMGFSGRPCYGFTTPENGATDVMFNISVTATPHPSVPPPVPEPGAYMMMLAGLGVIGLMARRRYS
jgi:hypothetical protein